LEYIFIWYKPRHVQVWPKNIYWPILGDQSYLSTSDRVKILQEDTRHMKIYYGEFSNKYNSGIYYFRWSKLLHKSCQICQTRSSCTVEDIFRATSGILLQFKLRWKLEILRFSIIYGRHSNSSKRERTTCLKSRLNSAKNVQKLKIRATRRNFSMKNFFILYFIYLFNVE
jgi:hypothetical protein